MPTPMLPRAIRSLESILRISLNGPPKTWFRRPQSNSGSNDHDVKPPRAMRTDQQGLLDIGRARWPGDEVERAWHLALTKSFADAGKDRLIIAADVLGREHHHVVVGQEIEGRRVFVPRH